MPDNDGPEDAGSLHRKLHVHQLDLLFRRLDSLPALPAVAAQLLRLAGRESPAVRELAAVVATDQSISAHLVSLAQRRRGGQAVESIEAAVQLLGTDAVRSAVLEMKVFQTFRPAAGGLELGPFWQHCVAVATIAAAGAARGQAQVDASTAFLCGLLHDIGKLALGHCLPKSYRRALQTAGAEQSAALQAERKILGTDHTVVGRRLGRHWNLPERVQEAIWLHHQPLEAIPAVLDRAGALAALVQLADALACERRFGFGGSHAVVAGSAELARQLGLGESQLTSMTAGVPQRLTQLDDVAAPQPAARRPAYMPTVIQTGAELARRSERLATRAADLQRQVRALNLLREFLSRIAPAMALPQVCREIGRTFAELAAGQPRAAAPTAVFALAGDEAHLVLALSGAAGEEAYRFTPCRRPPAAPPQQVCPAGPLLRQMLLPADAWADLLDVDGYACVPLAAQGYWTGGVLLPGQQPPAGTNLDELAPLLELMSFVLAAAAGRSKADALAEQLAQATQRLAETRRALAEAQTLASVGEMAAGAAHEINNPLAVIAGRAQILAGRLRTKRDREAAELIAEKAQEISEIATDLMAFARPAPPSPQATDVAELLSAVSEEVPQRALPKQAPVAVDIDIEPACPRVWVDAEQIEEVLLELVRNAATAAEGPVNVRLKASGEPGVASVRIQVSDDGPGMDEATLAAAFAPFYSNRPAGRGRGMGLARAKRTVQANGGEIWIDSQPSQGTTVTLELPRPRETPTSQ